MANSIGYPIEGKNVFYISNIDETSENSKYRLFLLSAKGNLAKSN